MTAQASALVRALMSTQTGSSADAHQSDQTMYLTRDFSEPTTSCRIQAELVTHGGIKTKPLYPVQSILNRWTTSQDCCHMLATPRSPLNGAGRPGRRGC